MKTLSKIALLLLFGGSMLLCTQACKDEKNSQPVVTDASLSPATVNAGGVLLVGAIASDPDGDPLKYTYTVTGGSVSADQSSVAVWKLPPEAGTYSLTVKASDGNGGETSFTKSFTTLPAVTQVSGVARFKSGSVGDLSGTAVGVQTSTGSTYNSTVSGGGTTVVFNLPNCAAGNYNGLWLWKDIDNSHSTTYNDYFGWLGSGTVYGPIMDTFVVENGKTYVAEITMYIATPNK